MKGNKNAFGHTHSEEVREKIRLSNIGNKNALGCKRSKKTREKIRLASKRRWARERENMEEWYE
jgi:hypothetical protein